MHSLKQLSVSLVGREEPDPLLLNSFDMETPGMETLTGSDNPSPVAENQGMKEKGLHAMNARTGIISSVWGLSVASLQR